MSTTLLANYVNALGETLTANTSWNISYWAAAPGVTITAAGGGHTLYGDIWRNDYFFIYSATDLVIPAAASPYLATVFDGAEGETYTLAAGVQNLVLSNDQETAVGNALDNLIIADGTTDTMSGGGGDDIFVCGAGTDAIIDPLGSGSDVIYDFVNGVDHVSLPGGNFSSFADILAGMQQVGGDVVLNVGDNETLTFRNTVIGNFVASDFWLPVDTAPLALTFDDEFNSFSGSPTGVGTTWQTTYYGGWRNNGEGELNSDSTFGVNPFSVSNGTLTITAAPITASPATYWLGYTSGVITTEQSHAQLYGYFDIRAEMPSGAGFWPAFWLLPEDGAWPPELDVFEQLSSNSTDAFVTTHSNVGGINTQISYNLTVPDPSQGFHDYGVYWGPDYIRWYFDGQEVAMAATPADMNVPMYMIVNLSVVTPAVLTSADAWEGAAASGETGQMLIDYVRAYAYTGSDPMITGYPSALASLPTRTVASASPAAAAEATVSATTIDFGTVHVGDVVTRNITIANGASGSNVDLLTGGFGTILGGFSGTGSLGSGLAAGAIGTLTLGLSTGTAGLDVGSAALALDSLDSEAGSTALDTSSIQLTGTIDNYATAGLSLISGSGTLTGSGSNFLLNLGSISPQSGGDYVQLALTNSATGVADTLSSSFSTTGGRAFYNGGLGSVSGLTAGLADTAPAFLFADNASGVYTETILITPSGSNSSGYIGALPTETLTVTGTIAPYYTLTTGNNYFLGGVSNDTFVTAAADLNPGDVIWGGGGTNTLQLVGGGTFDLSKVAGLSYIQVVTAQEGTGSAEPILKMRNYLNVAVNVQSSTRGSGGVIIYGANDFDIFKLGTGNDVVYVGSSQESVIGQGGANQQVLATAANAGVQVSGLGAGSTLEITSGGTMALNAATGGTAGAALTVKLDQASHLSLSGMSFITALGSSGSDVITANATNQTLAGGGGIDTLVGFAGGQDVFSDLTANLNGDTISGFTASDAIDLTDMAFNTASVSYSTRTSTLNVANGSKAAAIILPGSFSTGVFTLASDGLAGTKVTWHS